MATTDDVYLPFFEPIGFREEHDVGIDLSQFYIEVPVGFRVRITRDVGSPVISYTVDSNPD